MTEEIAFNKTNNRLYYLDVMRIVATFAVVLIHTVGVNWSELSPMTLNWQICR